MRHIDDLERSKSSELWNEREQANARVWRQLLSMSLNGMQGGQVPHMLRSELQSAADVELDAREWDRVRRWVKRNIRESLDSRLVRAKLPRIYEGRVSNPVGGRPEISEAQYFISLTEGPPIPKTGKDTKATTTEEVIETASPRSTDGQVEPAPQVPDVQIRPDFPWKKAAIDYGFGLPTLLF
ncbi:MAG: hypothetical protein KAG72_01595 [Abyssibacter sp.]|nr:hypothetical protein [Abyssibacter sp.]MCK5858014.1 hypothetical protein [Abyssibacter sp.]